MVVELCAVISISFVINEGKYSNSFRDIIAEHSGRNKKKKKEKNGTFATAHLCVSLSSTRLLGNYESC